MRRGADSAEAQTAAAREVHVAGTEDGTWDGNAEDADCRGNDPGVRAGGGGRATVVGGGGGA